MEQDLLQKDGNYNRLGFLLSNDGILIPFGYRNFYDVISHIGYENVDYLYHNTALLEELKHNPYLKDLKWQIERDYGPELIYSPFFPKNQLLTILARNYEMTAFKMVNIPDTEEKKDFLVIASHLSKEAYDILFTLNQHGIFQRLQLCRWIQNDGAYIDYEDMNEFLNDYQIKKRK